MNASGEELKRDLLSPRAGRGDRHRRRTGHPDAMSIRGAGQDRPSRPDVPAFDRPALIGWPEEAKGAGADLRFPRSAVAQNHPADEAQNAVAGHGQDGPVPSRGPQVLQDGVDALFNGGPPFSPMAIRRPDQPLLPGRKVRSPEARGDLGGVESLPRPVI